jgi:hypothetical protein
MLALVGAGGMLWIGVPAWRQYVAVREIERIGGLVYQNRIGPGWLRELLGEEQMALFDPVEYVHFRPDRETFDRRFSGFYSGRVPHTEGPTVDDTKLVCIADIPKLERLDLRWTNTPAALKWLSELPDLESLYIDLESVYFDDDTDPWVAKESVEAVRRALPGVRIQ